MLHKLKAPGRTSPCPTLFTVPGTGRQRAGDAARARLQLSNICPSLTYTPQKFIVLSSSAELPIHSPPLRSPSLLQVGMGQMECYERDFEEFLLKDTAEYYKRKAAAWIQVHPDLTT